MQLSPTRPLIVGQAPSRSMKPGDRPIVASASWRRLCVLAGADPEELADRVDTTNLIEKYPGAAGKYDLFPEAQAIQGAQRILSLIRTQTPKCMLVLGAGTARFMDLPQTRPYEEITIRLLNGRNLRAGWIPHPGGTNMHYNNYANRERASEFLREFLL